MTDVLGLIAFIVIPAIVLHEVAHGLVAYWLGDPTAKNLGRLSLNPIKHIDPLGSIIIPGGLFLMHYFKLTSSLMLFGWAKPVPVNFRQLKPRRLGMILVAAAGPAVNIGLAYILAQMYHSDIFGHWYYFLGWGILLNLSLAVFNLVPIPPLDGSRIVSAMLPDSLAAPYSRLEPYGLIIVVVLINLGFMRFLYPLISVLASGMGIQF